MKTDTLQLIGVIITTIGFVSLLGYAVLAGTPVSNMERRRMGDHRRTSGMTFFVPLTVESLGIGLIILLGLGLLLYSGFNPCSFTRHWWPEAPAAFLASICR